MNNFWKGMVVVSAVSLMLSSYSLYVTVQNTVHATKLKSCIHGYLRAQGQPVYTYQRETARGRCLDYVHGWEEELK